MIKLTRSDPRFIAACNTKQIKPSTVQDAYISNHDIFLVLNTGERIRVESSALPTELTRQPLPTTTQAQPTARPASRAKKKSVRKKITKPKP
jgi:hypothetical protein